MGWNLDLGAIQRSTKRGVDYSGTDFVAVMNGASSELVQRTAWGTNYYGAKVEEAFSKYYYNSGTGGWEVTSKDGTVYYYGSTSASRQDNTNGVFKWCLDRVEDTNGNYMTVTYTKDQGQIYPDRIDYTGNGSLTPPNYVKFYLESRTDVPPIYNTNGKVVTTYRLKSIDIQANGNRARLYHFEYDPSNNTSRSIISEIKQYGGDAQIDASGNVISGSQLPETGFDYTSSKNGFDSPQTWLPASVPGIGQTYSNPYQYVGDFNGDGKADYMWCYNGWHVALNSSPFPDLLSDISSPLGGTV